MLNRISAKNILEDILHDFYQKSLKSLGYEKLEAKLSPLYQRLIPLIKNRKDLIIVITTYS